MYPIDKDTEMSKGWAWSPPEGEHSDSEWEELPLSSPTRNQIQTPCETEGLCW